MLGYLSLDIICSSKLTVFLELRSRQTFRFSEQIISADKYPSIFSRQMKAIVYIYLIVPFWYKSAAYQTSLVEPWYFGETQSSQNTQGEIKRLGIYRTQIQPKN